MVPRTSTRVLLTKLISCGRQRWRVPAVPLRYRLHHQQPCPSITDADACWFPAPTIATSSAENADTNAWLLDLYPAGGCMPSPVSLHEPYEGKGGNAGNSEGASVVTAAIVAPGSKRNSMCDVKLNAPVSHTPAGTSTTDLAPGLPRSRHAAAAARNACVCRVKLSPRAPWDATLHMGWNGAATFVWAATIPARNRGA